MSTISCKFKFECPQEWSTLDSTPTPGVRFCNNCKSNVYFASTPVEFEHFAREDKCVALMRDDVLMLGMPDGYSDPYLLVLAQEYSLKQLYLLGRLTGLGTAVLELRDTFYMKEVKFEHLTMADALARQAAFAALGIASRVERNEQ